MTNHHDNKMQWFWLGVRRLFSATMSSTLSRLRSLMMTAFVGAALCTTAHAQTQDPSAKAPPSAVAVAQPSTQGPTQAEMDKADTDPNQWLTSNKGYLGYRYSKLAADQYSKRQHTEDGVLVQIGRTGIVPECSTRLQRRSIHDLRFWYVRH